MNNNYYELLGVTNTASQSEIKAAYRDLAKTYHPDLNKASNASAMFRLIKEAYDTLGDPVSRAVYDSGSSQSRADEYETHYDSVDKNPLDKSKSNLAPRSIGGLKVLGTIIHFFLRILAIPFFLLVLLVYWATLFIGFLSNWAYGLLTLFTCIGLILAIQSKLLIDFLLPMSFSFVGFLFVYFLVIIQELLEDFIMVVTSFILGR